MTKWYKIIKRTKKRKKKNRYSKIRSSCDVITYSYIMFVANNMGRILKWWCYILYFEIKIELDLKNQEGISNLLEYKAH